tara:strand:+ start:25146 stop:29834 length:4689 start_codon:yes stop_codon:yes gene_type:complete
MRIAFLLLFLLGISCSIFGQQPAIYINEILTSNVGTNADMVDFGDFSDWVELYNNENVPVDISGFYITDDLANPIKWQIPSGTIIPSKGFYLLWADDFDDIPGQEYIRSWWPRNIPYTTQWSHTNFKLAKEGEEVGLFSASGLLIDSIVYGSQIEDVSYGRKPNGSQNWYFFGEPTPQATNSTIGLTTTEFAKGVLFSQEGGFYSGPISVELSSSNGNGTVRYTLDGSEPKSNSPAYSNPISVTSNTMLSARVFEDGKLPGEIFSGTYFIGENRTLPAFSIITEYNYLMGREQGIYRNTLKEREIPINLEFFPLESERGFSQRVGMRIGGENIFRFAQKPLNIYANGDYGESQIEYQVFDHLPYQAYKRLYLRNSGDDWPYTMIRDGLISSILRGEISNSTQAYRPTVLYLNGDYWGIYNLREKLDKQYFSLHYSTAEVDLDHLESNNTVIEGDNSDYIALLDFASNNDLSNSENYATVASQIDVHNLMDFVITQTYLANSSWSHNREVWRDRGNDNKWKWVLVDMDRGFNDSRISSNQIDDMYTDFELFRYLTDNTVFLNEFVQRYSERLNTTFSSDRIISIIDSLQVQIEPEMPRHIEQWGKVVDSLTISGLGTSSGITSIDFWKSEIETFRTFAKQRQTNAIQHLANQFDLGERVQLNISSNLSNKGKVKLNSFIKNIEASGSYFEGVPITLKAFAPPGYAFKSWSMINSNSNNFNIISTGSNWRYFDGSGEPLASWKSIDYNDSGWSNGQGVFGYGDSQTTEIEYGGNTEDKYITSYYRKSFQIDDLSKINDLSIKLLRDDGAVVYLNGVEVVRSNMPDGTVSNSTEASSSVGGSDEDTYFDFSIALENIVRGENIVAVEVHQSDPSSSDVSFDLGLSATLNETNQNPTIYSLDEEISITLSGDTELSIQFEEVSNSFIPSSITQSTTLGKINSPYFVNETVAIGATAVLTVEEGVEILFNDNKSILVNGGLNLEGSEEQPIVLKSYYPEQEWAGLFFENASEISTLNHVSIRQAKGRENDENFFASVSALNSTVNLFDVDIEHVWLPISSQFSSMRIENSTISNVTMIGDYLNVNGGNLWVLNSIFEGNNIEDMDAIDIGFMEGTTVIDGNIFRNFVGDNTDGIDVGDESIGVVITNNRVINCGDKSVSIGQGSEAYIAFNVFSRCNLGVGIKDEGSFAEIVNNTFYNNNVGVAIYEKVLNRGGGSANIKNSIFGNSQIASITADEFSSFTVDYSISDTDVLPGTGNLYGDAELINPDEGNFYPQINARVLGAGDPSTPIDGGGMPINIGAFGIKGVSDSELVINEINYNSSDSFDSEDWVEFFNASKRALDISGWTFIDGSRKQTFVFNSGTVLSANSFIVVARNVDKFKALYPNVSVETDTMNTGLSGNGESLYLYRNDGYLVDSLIFTDSNPWPGAADGNGSTLELMNPWLDNSRPENWRASLTTGTPSETNTVFIVSNENNYLDDPTEFKLEQNYPNPFNPSTVINYQIPKAGRVSLQVFDLLGRRVATLVDGRKEAGFYQIKFDAQNLASGVYLYRLQSGSQIFTKKLTLIK